MLNTLLTDSALLAARRDALIKHASLTGIDYVKLIRKSPLNKWYLAVYFLQNSDPAKKPNPIPDDIKPSNISLLDAEDNPVTQLYVNQVYYPTSDIGQDVAEAVGYTPQTMPKNLLIIELIPSNQGLQLEAMSYTLRLSNVNKLDAFFSQTSFSPQVNQTTDFDYSAVTDSEVTTNSQLPEINYLTRDYFTFRQLLLDRLAVLLPDWQLGHPADMPTAMIEILAHVADQVSYYQDVVATEAYLNTARQRISVKRHAKLLGYTMHEGCNARVWVHLQVAAALNLPAHTPVLTQIAGQGVCLADSVFQRLAKSEAEAFATLYPVNLYPAQNAIPIYTWGIKEYSLAKGATSATLLGKIDSLAPGDVILLEQVKPITSNQDIGPSRRHIVRLTAVNSGQKDELGGLLQGSPNSEPVALTEISWQVQDALPFSLTVSSVIDGKIEQRVSLARGNLVLADHGRWISDADLSLKSMLGNYALELTEQNLTYAVPFDNEAARLQPASLAYQQQPQQAQPVIELTQNEQLWQIKLDLLNSSATAQDCVVEINDDRQVFIRFGDNQAGKQPDVTTPLQAEYRIGNGNAGNIGANTLRHVVLELSPEVVATYPILAVFNPLPAVGGTEPQTKEQVKLYAPHSLGKMQRAVTLSDYIYFAEQHPQVAKAAVIQRWTGSWAVTIIAIDRKNGLPVDSEFQTQLLDYFASYSLFGHELQIMPPTWVPLDIALTVAVNSGYSLNAVKRVLLERFSNRELADGQRGYFHPDNFSFGDSVYLSPILAAVQSIPGVASINLQSKENRFRRRYDSNNDAFAQGVITIGKLEIAQLANNVNVPSQGQIKFIMEYSYV